jgi:hypothetical protein
VEAMTFGVSERIGIPKQRGFWLRCFLGFGSMPVIFFAFAVGNAHGQVVVLKPLYLSHAYGYVLSETGNPLTKVQVALGSGAQPSEAVVTDAKGHFDFSDAKGEYLLHVRIPGSAGANRQVIVGAGVFAFFHRGPLYIMIKPEVCEDCVSPIFTNKKQFDRAMREMNGNHD